MDLISSDDDTEDSEEFDIEDFPFEELEWFWLKCIIKFEFFYNFDVFDSILTGKSCLNINKWTLCLTRLLKNHIY